MKKHLEELLKTAKIVPATNQCECHPLLSQEKLRKYCKEKGIVFEAYSPLAKGKILNNETIKKIAKKYNKSVAQICLRWNIQHGMVTLPKSANEQRIKENMEIFDFELSEEDMNTLDGLNKNWHCTWYDLTNSSDILGIQLMWNKESSNVLNNQFFITIYIY